MLTIAYKRVKFIWSSTALMPKPYRIRLSSCLSSYKRQFILLFANTVQQYYTLNKVQYVFYPLKYCGVSRQLGRGKAGNQKIRRADPLIRCTRTSPGKHTLCSSYVLYSNRKSGLYQAELVFMDRC